MSAAAGAAPPRRAILAALAAAFALRVAAGLALNVEGGVHRGFDFYGFMADHLLDGRGLVWSFYDDLGDKWANRAPLYPLLVAAVRFAAGRGAAVAVVAVQAAIGAAACLVPAAFASRWGGTRAALVAVWAAALWPYSVVLDTGLVEHVLYAPLAGLAVLLTLRACDGTRAPAGFAAGALAGLATLARLTFAPTAAFLGAACALRRGGLLRAGLFAAGVALVVLPWAVRNHERTGAWVLGTDSGRALWVGNAEATFRHYPARSIDDAERELSRGLSVAQWGDLRAQNGDEVAQDRVFRGWALSSIAARPGEVAWGGLRKVAALWSPVMNPGPAGVVKLAIFGASLAALLAATLAAAALLPRIAADLPALVAAAATFTAVSAVFWGQSRYLAPLHGIGIAAAAAWIASGRDRRAADAAR